MFQYSLIVSLVRAVDYLHVAIQERLVEVSTSSEVQQTQLVLVLGGCLWHVHKVSRIRVSLHNLEFKQFLEAQFQEQLPHPIPHLLPLLMQHVYLLPIKQELATQYVLRCH